MADATEPIRKSEFQALAAFRYALRRFLRFSEIHSRRFGITPQQYQLLLAIKGTFSEREWLNLTELAERLQVRHNAAVQLTNRAEKRRLVARSPEPDDARQVRVALTPKGESLLARLAAIHRNELARMSAELRPPVP